MASQNLSTVLRIIARDETKGAITKTKQELLGMGNALTTIKNQALALAGINFGLGGLAQLAATADSYQLLTARLQLLSGETENFAALQEKVFQVAQDTFSSYDQIVQIYGNLAASTKEVGLESEDLLTITQALSEAYIISGSTQQEAKASTIQLVQALASGQLRGQEFNSVAEQGRRILFALKDATGLSAGELRQFANEGKLTTDFFVNNFLPQAEKINEEFQQLPLTVARSLTQLQNAFLQTVGRINQEEGVTLAIAESIQAIAFNFDELADGLLTAGGTVVAFLTGRFVAAQTAAAQSTIRAALATRQATQAELAFVAAKERAATRAVQVALQQENAARRLVVLARQQKINLETQILLNQRLTASVAARQAAEQAAAAAATASAAASAKASLLLRSFQGVVTFLGGPVGALTALVIGLGVAFKLLDDSIETGSEALEDFRDQIKKTEEAADDVKKATGQLSTSLDGLLTDETRAKFAREIATLAQGEAAVAKLQRELDEALAKADEAASPRARQAFINTTIQLREELEEAKELVAEYREEVKKQIDVENELREARENDAVGGVPAKLKDAIAEQDDANEKLKDIEKERRKVIDALDKLSQELAGPDIDFEEQTSAANIFAVNRLRDEIQTNLDDNDVESALENLKKAQQGIEALRDQPGVGKSYLQTQVELLKELAEEAGEIDQAKLLPAPVDDLDRAADEIANWREGVKNLFGFDLDVDLDENLVRAKAARTAEAVQETLDENLVFLRWGNSAPPGAEAPAFASGGQIRGPGTGTSDSILSWLSNGEYVIRAAAAKYYGMNLLDSLNNMRLPRFAAGGLVRTVTAGAGAGAAASGTPIIFNINGQQLRGTISGSDSGELRTALERFSLQQGAK